MELADMRDLGSRAERRAGSTPVTRTTSERTAYRSLRLFTYHIMLGEAYGKHY